MWPTPLIGCAKINFLDPFIGANLRRRSFEEYASIIEDGNSICEVKYDLHIMFNDEDGHLWGKITNHGSNLLRFY
jgi:hypothetical protein